MTLTLEHRIILAEMAVREAERKLEELRDERQRGLVEKYQCTTCQKVHLYQNAAAECCPIPPQYLCGRCGEQYRASTEAEWCCAWIPIDKTEAIWFYWRESDRALRKTGKALAYIKRIMRRARRRALKKYADEKQYERY